LPFFLDDRPSEKECKRLWFAHREVVMATIGEKYPEDDERHHLYIPFGCRPYMWWRYEAPELPRRLLVGDASKAMPEHGYFWGMFKVLMTSQLHQYESQPAYLRRHRLLMEGEEEKILPEAYEWN
jgi:hypothetical protein